MLDKKTVSQCISADYCRGWNDAVDAMPRWISVREMLPDIDRLDGDIWHSYGYSADLLVYDGFRRRIAYYCHTTDVWHDSMCEDDTFEATHWMPLPAPPEE